MPIEQIRWARGHGLQVFAETCPQYLFLTAEDLGIDDSYQGARCVCSPPPRDKANQEVIWQGLADGLFTVFSSDHAPFRYDAPEGKKPGGREVPFRHIPNGIPGLETRMPLLYSEGVLEGRISLNKFVELTATNPAKAYGLHPRKGTIAIGSDADLVIWDEGERVLRNSDLHHDVDYTPYEGQRLRAWPGMTLSRGEVVWDGREFIGARRARAIPALRDPVAFAAPYRFNPATFLLSNHEELTMTLRPCLKTVLAAVLAAAFLLPAAQAQDHIKFKAVGQPLATGLIQKNKEQPFFENFAKNTGLPIDVDYKPIDTLGIKDTEQLRVMKAGLFDIVSLRVSQNSRDEPTLLGLDLVGRQPGLRHRPQGGQGLLRHRRPAPAAAVQRQAAGGVAVRAADPVLQEADHQAGRHQGHEGPRLRPEPGQVHRDGRRHAGAGFVRRHPPVAVAGRRRLRDHRSRVRPTPPAGPR